MSEFHCAHAQDALNNMPAENTTENLARFFKVFGDDTRIRILFAIKDEELCVHDLTKILGMQQSAVSHQLRTLRHYNLVRARRDGQMTFYSLDDQHIFNILDVGLQHISHTHK